MTKADESVTQEEALGARAALVDGLEGGIFHLHLCVLGQARLRFVLIPVDGQSQPLCGTPRCIPLNGKGP